LSDVPQTLTLEALKRLLASIAVVATSAGALATALILAHNARNESEAPVLVSNAPEYVLEHAPILYYDHKEPFVPIDASAYVRHTFLVDVAVLPNEGKKARAAATRDPKAGAPTLSGLQPGSPPCEAGALSCHYALAVALPRRGHGPLCGTLARARLLCLGRLGRYKALQATLLRAGARRTVYWRPITSGNKVVGVQYWFFYVFNKWLNWHEGDWEQITLQFEPDGRLLAGYSAHKHGHRREIGPGAGADGTHPIVFVAAGSHANYFNPNPHEVDDAPAVLRKACRHLNPKHDPCRDHTRKPRKLDFDRYELVRIGSSGWPHYAGDFGSGNFSEHGLKCVFGNCFDYGVNVRDPTNAGLAWNKPLEWLAKAPPEDD
jgi:hypothetical protein